MTTSTRTRPLARSLLLLASLMLAAGCEGQGSGGEAARIVLRNTPECLLLAGGFPPGFDLLPGAPDQAVVAQFVPTAVLGLDLDREPPRLLATDTVPDFPERICPACGGLPLPDSDGDGEADACQSEAAGFGCLSPTAGSLLAVGPDLAALSTSSFEQVVLVDPRDGRLRDLVVATSNLVRSSRAQFDPGSVLVFDLDLTTPRPEVRPHASGPIILTTGFNPTSVTAHTTPAGRRLALVAVSGALALGTGPDLVRSDSAVDVIDPDLGRVVATIPLGRAGLGFDRIAIDPTGRLALLGAATSRALFGIDLAALDDPSLGHGPDMDPLVLDGSTPGAPDARVFDADTPFALPRRASGAAPDDCTTQTSVAISDSAPRVVASDFCDGSLTVLDLALPADRTRPLDPASVLRVDRVQAVAAAIADGSTGRLRAIDRVRLRPGRPGIDWSGPDAYFTAGLPEGAVCGARIDAL
ncbi:MAG: hypothetical protein KC616_13145 [Myxococcales bacterium]|nr:hypothetical protein [Myxococcales bacterium]